MKLVKDIDNNQNSKKISDKEAEEAFKTILAWMGEDPSREGLLETPKRVVKAFKKTIETKEAHYYSRSRKAIWHKGKTSGFIQKVIEIKIDDDQDSVWLSVDIGDGASCHVGYRSCFYRSIPLGPIDNGREVKMKFTEKEKKFDPEKIYKGQPNPTKI